MRSKHGRYGVAVCNSFLQRYIIHYDKYLVVFAIVTCTNKARVKNYVYGIIVFYSFLLEA